MTYQPETDDAIVGNLLRHGQDLSRGAETESAEDLFELFVEGRLPEADQEEFYRYLDANPSARRAASLYLESLEGALDTAPESDPPTLQIADAPRPRRSFGAGAPATYAVALAACLLLAIGAVFLTRGSDQVRIAAALDRSAELIASGDFDQAESLLDGIDREDPRVRLLTARAVMHESEELSDAAPWSLLAYGYELGDAVPMDGAPSADALERLSRAKALVEGMQEQDLSADLARAWLSLKQNDPDGAGVVLDRVLATHPDDAAANLARGVAHFMQDEFEMAEARFRRHLDLSPDSFAGRINLAKCLAEQGEYGPAREQLEALDPSDAPSEDVRRQIAAETARLRDLVPTTE